MSKAEEVLEKMKADAKEFERQLEEQNALVEQERLALEAIEEEAEGEVENFELARDELEEAETEVKAKREAVKEAIAGIKEKLPEESELFEKAFPDFKGAKTGNGKASRGASWLAIEKVLMEAGSKGLTAKEIEEKAGLTGGQVRGQQNTHKEDLRNESGRWYLK